MIAVIERSRRVVWGFGRTAPEAMKDAQGYVTDWKRHHPACDVENLEYAQLSPDADLGADGETLWQWVQESAPVQDGLF